MRTFLVDRVIDSEQSEGAIVPVVRIHSEYNCVEGKYYVTTTIKSLEFETLSSGQIITVIHVEPISFDEKLITGIYEYVDFCPVLKAGDHLRLYHSSRKEEKRGYRCYEPCLKANLAAYLPNVSEDSRFRRLSRPHKCPRCQSDLFRPEDNVLRCYNFSCPASLTVSIFNWRAWAARKDTLEFIDYQFAVQLVESGIVTSIAELYNLKFEQLTETVGLTKKQAKNMLLALEHSKRHPWPWLLERLCTRSVGYTVKKLAGEFSSFEEIAQADIFRLQKVEDFSLSTAQSVYYWFKTSANRQLIRQLQEIGLQTSVPLKAKGEDSQQLLSTILQNIVKPITDSLSALWEKFRDKLQSDEKQFSHYKERFEKIENQLTHYEKLLLEKFDQLLKREDLEAIFRNSSSGAEASLLRQVEGLTGQYYQIQADLHAIRSALENKTQGIPNDSLLMRQYDQIQSNLYVIQSAIESSPQEVSDKSLLTEQYHQIQLDLHTVLLTITSNRKNHEELLTSKEFKKHQTQEVKHQESQLEKIEGFLHNQLEETRRKLQQFVTSSVQNVTKESAKVSDLEAILQFIDEVPGKIEKQLKLDLKLKLTSDELNKLIHEVTSCKDSLQEQVADLIAQIVPVFETLQTKQNESSQAILDRFQAQDETLLNSIQAQQEEILPHFGTLQQQVTVISEQNERLNEQVATVRSQLDLEQQTLQTQNDRLQSEIQQSLKEQRTLTETLSERSQLLEEANHQLAILGQDFSPSIQLVIERLNQFQPGNTSPEILDVFCQLATQIHQANEQLQAVRPVAAPLIDGLRQENAELQKQVQQTKEEGTRLRESLDSTNTELSHAQLTSDRLNQEKSSLERSLSDTRSQLEIAHERYANSQSTLNCLSTELHEQLYQAQRDVTRLDLEKSDFERQLAETRTQLEKTHNRQITLEGERDSLTSDLNQARDQLGQSERGKLSLQSQVGLCELKLRGSQETLQKSQQRVLLLEEQQGQLPLQVASLEGRLEENHKTTTDLRKSVGDLQSRLTQTQALYDQTLQHLEKCHKARTDLETQLKAVETELSETKAELQLTQKGLQGFINEGFRRDRQARS